VSLLVDEIGDVVEPPEDAFEPSPETVPAALRELIRGVYKLEDALLIELDTEKTLAVSETTLQPGRDP
jgi:purine-binding chemotaxis protein CheW